MIRCQHCGEEVAEGKQFCPFCGKPASGEVVESHQVPLSAETASPERAAGTRAPAPRPAPMSGFERSKDEGDKSRRTIFIAVAIVSAVLVGGLAWWATRPSAQPAEPRLEGALRPGSPEFEQARDRLVIEFNPDEHAFVNERALGDIVITLRPTIRNFTGRTVSGLELRAIALDLANQPIKVRTVIPVPNQQGQLEPNKTFSPSILLEGIAKENRPANLKLELTGVKFK